MVVQSLACFHGRKSAIWQLSRNSCTGCHSAACSHSLCRDHRQTPGGLSKGRAAAANRQKLLQRPLGLRALNRPGDHLLPARLACLVGVLWPEASQDNDSEIARLLHLARNLIQACGQRLRHRDCRSHWRASLIRGHSIRLMQGAALLLQFLRSC